MTTPRCVALVQARMGSTRFPGKMLERLGEHTLLEWVLKRLGQSSLLSEIVLATSDKPVDDALIDAAHACNAKTFRGSEQDVLGRFHEAATRAQADIVVRVCADNPLIDANEVDRLIQFYQDTRCDYACNHQSRLDSGYADGFGAEILSMTLLDQLNTIAKNQPHREHVTTYIWDHPDTYTIRAVPAPPELAFPDLRFDIDTPDDLVYLSGMLSAGITLTTKAAEIIRIAHQTTRPSIVP